VLNASVLDGFYGGAKCLLMLALLVGIVVFCQAFARPTTTKAGHVGGIGARTFYQPSGVAASEVLDACGAHVFHGLLERLLVLARPTAMEERGTSA